MLTSAFVWLVRSLLISFRKIIHLRFIVITVSSSIKAWACCWNWQPTSIERNSTNFKLFINEITCSFYLLNNNNKKATLELLQIPILKPGFGNRNEFFMISESRNHKFDTWFPKIGKVNNWRKKYTDFTDWITVNKILLYCPHFGRFLEYGRNFELTFDFRTRVVYIKEQFHGVFSEVTIFEIFGL